MNGCTCKEPGWCERHKVQKSARMHKLCQMGARGEKPGVRYWKAWEKGRGPGQRVEVSKRPRRKRPSGPGTELKWILGWLLIGEKASCGCGAMAAQMDRWGPSGCREKIDAILGHMDVEARKRKLPFVRAGAKKMVDWAIRRAERKSQSNLLIGDSHGHQS